MWYKTYMFSEYVGTHSDWDLFFLVHVQDSVVAQFGMHYWSAAFKSEIRTRVFVAVHIRISSWL